MKTFRWQAHKPLLATALAVAGVFNMVSAVLADGTAAGTDISNTATATYSDGNGNPFNATSNTVVIKVAEIAGLNAVARPVLDADGGAIEAGDDLTFIFDVTNVGNAPTDVFVPGISNIVRTNFTPSATDPVQVFEANGVTLIGIVPAGGGTLTSIKGTPVAIAPDASFVVKVTGRPAAGAIAGNSVSVTLGNTTDNPTTEGTDQTQNQSDNDDAGTNADDLRTIDPTTGVPTDDPENGEREAQATASGIFASAVRPLALATVLKNSALTSTGNPSDPTDDRITYGLGLQVEGTTPNNLFQPAALEGTPISLNGSTQTRILVSDAIPAEAKLASVRTPLPAGWQAVYSVDPVGANPGSDPLTLAWNTVPPSNLNTVTRVGFVFSGSIGAGASVTGLDFTVVTSGLAATGGTIENIAQVFGETVGDATNQTIYDESGDSRPNNFDDGNQPPANDGSDYIPGTDDGVAPETDNNGDNQPDDPTLVDPGNNSGLGPKGELNVISITPTTDDILNGTKDTPNAIGPIDDNDDFTNKSTPVPAGLDPLAPFDPNAVLFNNSLSNPAATGFIAETTVQPLSPSEAEAASGKPAGTYGSNTDIPDGTIVTISFGAQTAVYTYDQAAGTFNLTSGTPVNVGDVVAGQEVDYTVEVDLPAGTLQLDEVSIPIVAFPDDDPLASPGYTGETTNNITIDRLYTGFMSLVKEAQILDKDGTTVIEGFTQTPTRNAAPDQFIEYRISYENISQSLTGPGSIRLTANNFTVLEDGTDTPNNWALFTTHQQNTTASNGGLRFYTLSADVTPASTTDPASGTPIEKYENVVPSVAPGITGTFKFRRVVD